LKQAQLQIKAARARPACSIKLVCGCWAARKARVQQGSWRDQLLLVLALLVLALLVPTVLLPWLHGRCLIHPTNYKLKDH
jgi:hypothetical protein